MDIHGPYSNYISGPSGDTFYCLQVESTFFWWLFDPHADPLKKKKTFSHSDAHSIRNIQLSSVGFILFNDTETPLFYWFTPDFCLTNCACRDISFIQETQAHFFSWYDPMSTNHQRTVYALFAWNSHVLKAYVEDSQLYRVQKKVTNHTYGPHVGLMKLSMHRQMKCLKKHASHNDCNGLPHFSQSSNSPQVLLLKPSYSNILG